MPNQKCPTKFLEFSWSIYFLQWTRLVLASYFSFLSFSKADWFSTRHKVSPPDSSPLSRTNHSNSCFQKLIFQSRSAALFIYPPGETSKTNSQMNFWQPYSVSMIYKLKLNRQGSPKWYKTIVLKSLVNFPLTKLDIFKHLHLSFILIYTI